MEPMKSMLAGHEFDLATETSLSRLRVGLERSKINLKKLGTFRDSSTNASAV